MKIAERITLQNILPREGNFEDLIIFEEIKKKINITSKEVEELEIKTLENGSITWNGQKDKGIKVDFSEIEKNKIGNVLKKLSDENKLTVEMLELYKQFN